MKLIIQIPCYNEEHTLESVLRDLPKEIPGIDEIETLVIDDGSTDATVAKAKELGVNHVVSLQRNSGLAKAFSTGLEECVKRGADIIVNTDGDNQYQGRFVADVVQPVAKGEFDIIVGTRPIMKIDEFSFAKKILQRIGSWVVRTISGTSVPDTTSGFRAISKEAAMRIVIMDGFTYTLETLIQAGSSSQLKVGAVDIDINPKTRDSRLFKGIPQYIKRSMSTIVKMFIFYKPFHFFFSLASLFFLSGFVLGVRFLLNIYYYAVPDRTYVPSLILMVMLGVFGVGFVIAGVLGFLISKARDLQIETIYLHRKKMWGSSRNE